MEKLIKYLIISIVLAVLISYINKQANSKIYPTANNEYRLRLNKLYWYISLLAISFGLLGFIFSGLEIEDGNGWLIGLIFLILFGSLGFICGIWYINHKIKFDPYKIEGISVYGKKSSISWEEINSVKLNPLTGLLIFSNNENKKIKAHIHLVGITELLKMMEAKTNCKIKDLKLPF